MRWLFTLVIAANTIPLTLAAEPITHGTIAFTSDDVTNNVPERYRLAPHSFEFERQLKYDLKGSEVEVFSIRFPSPSYFERARKSAIVSWPQFVRVCSAVATRRTRWSVPWTSLRNAVAVE